MTSKLPPSPSLESLRKQAKHLIKSFRQSEPEAVARVERSLGARDRTLVLRDAQRVIAVEYGFPNWLELRRAVEAANAGRFDGDASPADQFLDLACLRYMPDEGPERWRRAQRLLERHPKMADENVFVAAAIGDAARVGRLLDTAPEKGGPWGWEPLLYLCYSRVPQRDALGTAGLLLSRGADANAHYFSPRDKPTYKYTALTGAFGKGESGPMRQPPHPEYAALARVLLEAKADPNDGQTLYQWHFTPENDFLEILFEYGLDPNTWSELLATSAKQGYADRVKLLIAHGAKLDVQDRHGKTAYENALLSGHPEIADELVKAGAMVKELDAAESFHAACRGGDVGAARALVARHPEFLEDPRFLLDAARSRDLRALELLLDLGCSPNLGDSHGSTALHAAAWNDDWPMVQALLARGADPTRRETYHNGTPASHAHYAGHRELARLLSSSFDDAVALVHFDNLERLREVLGREPARVARGDGAGRSLLHYVDVEAANAAEIVRLLLAAGAPIDARAGDGETPLERFLNLKADELADLLIEDGASE